MTILYRHASPADAWAITEVNVATWRSAYRDIFPADFLANRSIPERSAQLEEYLCHLGRDIAFFVAEQGPDGIVGYVTGGPARDVPAPGYDGELGAIYILDAWQRQGIGRALVHLLASHLRARGYAVMYAWALRDNPYATFYGKLGAIEVGWQTRQIGEFSREEIAHGWPDIAALVALLSAGGGACSD